MWWWANVSFSWASDRQLKSRSLRPYSSLHDASASRAEHVSSEVATAAPALVPTKTGGNFHPVSNRRVIAPACHQQRLPPPAKTKVSTLSKRSFVPTNFIRIHRVRAVNGSSMDVCSGLTTIVLNRLLVAFGN